MATDGQPSPDGVYSVLDTDLYKLTMQCAILKYFPDAEVSYKLTNRTPHMKLNRGAFQWLQNQIQNLGNLFVTPEEIEWLEKACPYLSKTYLEYLKNFRFYPSKHVTATFTATHYSQNPSTPGDLAISVHGIWAETILYEIPLLALVSEAYFKFVDRDWDHTDQFERAHNKGLELLTNGCVFSEFGSRRRRDYRTQELVLRGLIAAQDDFTRTPDGSGGKLSGTSNVHFAMRLGLAPVGTVAHEWFMGIAALTQDYAGANERALQHWVSTFGPGVLAIALTDTFGTPSFLTAFARRPAAGLLAPDDPRTYAQLFTGVRQDSGDPLAHLERMRAFYAAQGIREKKTIVFSDSLNVARCIRYRAAAEEAGLTPSFGVGTFFTNDFERRSSSSSSSSSDPGKAEKSVPLNIVIKLSEVQGQPAIKLSDDTAKNMGESEWVGRVKAQVGYADKAWADGDEAHRWDRNDA